MRHLIETSGAVAIIATTVELLETEARSTDELARALAVAPPVAWPPQFNGEDYRSWMKALLARHANEPGYGGWYLVGAGELVGTCGFKGPPDAAGEVEVGYSVIEPRRRRGFARAAVGLLVARALRDPRVTSILAETLPDGTASQGVLARCGFEPFGGRIDQEDGEVLIFRRKR